eukprot:gb/GECG01006881.1/.p1 GENE.gb/GECG01006881.1/~~gb/GECG01006881.1/.p1  ORF type:complete len:113 (+),score=5.71 gb/GECG01006881.1/:1-339(+)
MIAMGGVLDAALCHATHPVGSTPGHTHAKQHQLHQPAPMRCDMVQWGQQQFVQSHLLCDEACSSTTTVAQVGSSLNKISERQTVASLIRSNPTRHTAEGTLATRHASVPGTS